MRIMHGIFKPVDNLGRTVINTQIYTWEILKMVYLSLRAALVDHSQGWRTIFGVISAQVYFTGWQALPLISVLAIATGGIVVLQSSMQLSLLGGSGLIGNLMIVIIVREVGPLLTALIVIARSGTAVASEIGTMRVNREIEALEVMGIHPLSFIVFPRLMGGVISVLCLAFYFNFISVMGGFVITKFVHDMPFSFYTDSLAQAFTTDDIFIFFLKNGFSGMIIFVICCYQGLSVRQSPHEVPQVTTKAVVNSVIYVVCFNALVTLLFYLNRLIALGIL
jgi:phospholipid/cholesterol/gamma-HCH transport system permease protein